MRRRLFRRAAAATALASGITGIAANALLVLFFALARPWETGGSARWDWLGPANDIVGAVSMAAFIPAVVYLTQLLRDDRLLVVLGGVSILGMGGLAAAGPLLVAGQISLETQFVVAGLALPPLFGWLLRACLTGGRRGALAPKLALFGERIGAGALVGTAVAIASLALPTGSVAQYVALGLAAIPGLPAYLVFPVWQLRFGRRLLAATTRPAAAAVVRAGG